MEELLRVEGLQKWFPVRKSTSVCAVNGIDFAINSGETLGLVGESGSGKTTTGRCLLRLVEPTSGKILFKGRDVIGFEEDELRKLRSDLQIVFQEPYDSLNPRKVVRKIIQDPLVLEGKLNTRQRRARILEVMEMVELAPEKGDKYPIQLTQGEQQRVGIARAMATRPSLVVLDEPTSLLDIRFRAEIVLLLERLQKENGISYLFITHDLVVISELSHRIAVMYLGRIIEEGPVEKVMDAPLHPYTKALISSSLFPDPDHTRNRFVLKGEIPSPVNLPDDRCNLAPRCPIRKGHCVQSLPHLEDTGDGHLVACFEAEKL